MIGFIPVKDETERMQLKCQLARANIGTDNVVCQTSGVIGLAFDYYESETPVRLDNVPELSGYVIVDGKFPLNSYTALVWINRPGWLQQVVPLATMSGSDMKWSDVRRDRALQLLTEFAEAIGRPVRLSVPHQSKISLRGEEDSTPRFDVLVWSSPLGSAEIRPPESIWGHKTGCRDYSYRPSGQGIAIVDEATQWCVAELFPHQLYIHHDLCHKNQDAEVDVLERLLIEIIPHIAPVAIDSEAALQRQFTALCNRGRTMILKKTHASILEDERTIERLKRDLSQVMGRLAGRKLKQEQIEGIKPDADSQLAVLTSLRNHPQAVSVKVAYGVIEVVTARLYAVDPRTAVVHRLGAQTITIHPDGKNGGVRYVAIEGNISGTGRAVPHATKEGYIAHPEAVVAVTELLALQQFNEVFALAIQAAVEVMRDHTAGIDIAKWPHATPAELIGTEWEGQQVTVAA